MLPLPFLRAGYLTAPVEHTLGGPAEAWRREWFVLDHMSLRSASALESSLSSAASGVWAARVVSQKQKREWREGRVGRWLSLVYA